VTLGTSDKARELDFSPHAVKLRGLGAATFNRVTPSHPKATVTKTPTRQYILYQPVVTAPAA
jgi:hypothetical protein